MEDAASKRKGLVNHNFVQKIKIRIGKLTQQESQQAIPVLLKNRKNVIFLLAI
jgi:hypothetical protein